MCRTHHSSHGSPVHQIGRQKLVPNAVRQQRLEEAVRNLSYHQNNNIDYNSGGDRPKANRRFRVNPINNGGELKMESQ